MSALPILIKPLTRSQLRSEGKRNDQEYLCIRLVRFFTARQGTLSLVGRFPETSERA